MILSGTFVKKSSWGLPRSSMRTALLKRDERGIPGIGPIDAMSPRAASHRALPRRKKLVLEGAKSRRSFVRKNRPLTGISPVGRANPM